MANAWPPLPPEAGHVGASQLPGYGALASCAVEPHEGRIPAGGVVTWILMVLYVLSKYKDHFGGMLLVLFTTNYSV